MKKLLVALDDETAHLLAGEKNKSKIVREGIKYIKQDITTDTLQDMRRSFASIAASLKELDSKLDYIARVIPKG